MAENELKGKELLPHQQRVVDELNEVDNNLETIKDRSSKLNEFIMDNPIYLTLPEEEKTDLKAQYDSMCIIQDHTVDYRDALMRRISRF